MSTTDSPSNFRYTKTLNEVFEEHDIPAIWGVDTRALTRIIRDEGSQKVLITDVATPRDEALRKLGEYVMPRDMVSRVSCKKRWMSRVPNHKYDVVAVDCGIKYNIIRLLNRVGCNVTVMPYNSTVEEIMAFHPDGLVLSNGARQSRGRDAGDRTGEAAPRQAAHLRNLHGPPADFAGLRRPDLQDEVRPPRRQPPGEESRDGETRNHEPESQLRRGCRFARPARGLR